MNKACLLDMASNKSYDGPHTPGKLNVTTQPVPQTIFGAGLGGLSVPPAFVHPQGVRSYRCRQSVLARMKSSPDQQNACEGNNNKSYYESGARPSFKIRSFAYGQ